MMGCQAKVRRVAYEAERDAWRGTTRGGRGGGRSGVPVVGGVPVPVAVGGAGWRVQGADLERVEHCHRRPRQ